MRCRCRFLHTDISTDDLLIPLSGEIEVNFEEHTIKLYYKNKLSEHKVFYTSFYFVLLISNFKNYVF